MVKWMDGWQVGGPADRHLDRVLKEPLTRYGSVFKFPIIPPLNSSATVAKTILCTECFTFLAETSRCLISGRCGNSRVKHSRVNISSQVSVQFPDFSANSSVMAAALECSESFWESEAISGDITATGPGLVGFPASRSSLRDWVWGKPTWISVSLALTTGTLWQCRSPHLAKVLPLTWAAPTAQELA